MKDRKSIVDRFSLKATKFSEPKDYVPLAGALYCGRASTLRKIWEPNELRGTDVFVRDMVVTDNWRTPKNRQDERIILVPNATALFETYTSIGDMLYHQKRRVIALVTRRILHDFLTREVGEEYAGDLIRRLNEQNPGWYVKLIRANLRTDQWWVLPLPIFQFNRFKKLKGLSKSKWLLAFSVAVPAEIIDIYAALSANRTFKKQLEVEIWRRSRLM